MMLSTYNNSKDLINSYNASMKTAKQLKLITDNPCEGVILPKREKYEAVIYDNDEIKQVMALAKGTNMYPILLLGLGLGLRRGEIAALKWSHIDFENKFVHIQQNAVTPNGEVKIKKPKTKSSIRKIPIGDSMVQELKIIHKSYIESKIAQGKEFVDSDCVVFKENGESYNPDSITRKWTRFKEKNNLKNIRLHDMRHSNATALAGNGIDAATVRDMLGHTDIQTTLNYYTHSTNDTKIKAAEKIGDILFCG